MPYHHVNARINSSTDASTSYKKLVNISKVVFELKWGRMSKLCRDSAEILRSSFIQHDGVPKLIGKTQFCFQESNGKSILYIF